MVFLFVTLFDQLYYMLCFEALGGSLVGCRFGVWGVRCKGLLLGIGRLRVFATWLTLDL